jgi:hypothetical protein
MSVPLYAQVCIVSHFVPATTGIIRFKAFGKPMRFLAVLTVLACVQIAIDYAVATWKNSNNFLADYYTVVEFSLLWAVFFYSVTKRRLKLLMGLLGVIFLLVAALWGPLTAQPGLINSSFAVVSRLFFIGIALVAFYSVSTDGFSPLVERPVFWIVIGVLMYSSGTVLVFGLSNRLMEMGLPYFVTAWQINWTLQIAANLLYTKGMLCKVQE